MNLNKSGKVVIRPTIDKNVYVMIAKYAVEANMSPTKFIVALLQNWYERKVRDELAALDKEVDEC